MSKAIPRLPLALTQALEATGLPWRATYGGKHIKIFVGDRFVGVISHGRKDDIPGLNSNVISRIKQQAKV